VRISSPMRRDADQNAELEDACLPAKHPQERTKRVPSGGYSKLLGFET
jgi:hypothetical protein